MKPVTKYGKLVEGLRRYGLTNGSSLGCHMGIMDAAADTIEEAENTLSRLAEFRFLLSYAAESCFDEEICRDRLRMLWTAYCLHHGLDVDTSGYDNDLLELWNKLEVTGDGTADWTDYDDFDGFMFVYLV